MIAFVLPVVWGFTGLVALIQLARVSSAASFGAAGFEYWKMRKCVELGLDESTLMEVLGDPRSERARLAKMFNRHIGMNVLRVLPEGTESSLSNVLYSNREELWGEYLLTKDEMHGFVQGTLQLDLRDGVGPEAEFLKGLMSSQGRDFEELGFLWQDINLNVHQLQKVSKVRLADEVMRRSAGLS